MSSRLTAAVLLAGGLILACSEGVAPPADVQGPAVQSSQRSVIPAEEFKPLGWSAADPAPVFSGFATDADGTVLPPAGGLPDVPFLASYVLGGSSFSLYAVRFWAVHGVERSVVINYQSSSCATSNGCPFLRFTVPKEALDRWPDGKEFESGDSVLITVTVDQTQLLAKMEPSGLRFDDPPVLELWYTGASHDFNRDGVVNDKDAYIQKYELALFSQQDTADPWMILSSYHDVSEERFRARLRHFTGFAVSY